MRAVRHTARGIELIDVPAPTGPGVRVRVRSSGICGTDLVMTKGGPLPFTLGHEFAGLLDDGSAVAVEPIDACGTCGAADAGCSLAGEPWVSTTCAEMGACEAAKDAVIARRTAPERAINRFDISVASQLAGLCGIWLGAG